MKLDKYGCPIGGASARIALLQQRLHSKQEPLAEAPPPPGSGCSLKNVEVHRDATRPPIPRTVSQIMKATREKLGMSVPSVEPALPKAARDRVTATPREERTARLSTYVAKDESHPTTEGKTVDPQRDCERAKVDEDRESHDSTRQEFEPIDKFINPARSEEQDESNTGPAKSAGPGKLLTPDFSDLEKELCLFKAITTERTQDKQEDTTCRKHTQEGGAVDTGSGLHRGGARDTESASSNTGDDELRDEDVSGNGSIQALEGGNLNDGQIVRPAALRHESGPTVEGWVAIQSEWNQLEDDDIEAALSAEEANLFADTPCQDGLEFKGEEGEDVGSADGQKMESTDVLREIDDALSQRLELNYTRAVFADSKKCPPTECAHKINRPARQRGGRKKCSNGLGRSRGRAKNGGRRGGKSRRKHARHA